MLRGSARVTACLSWQFHYAILQTQGIILLSLVICVALSAESWPRKGQPKQ